jgi:hypothetical protein
VDVIDGKMEIDEVIKNKSNEDVVKFREKKR